MDKSDSVGTGWQVMETDWGDVHVMPIGDLRPHIAEARCWCGPRQDEQDGFVIIHDAIDLRQEYERGRQMS